MKTTRRFKAIYVGITVLFVLVAFGFAAAGIWVVALATLAMGGVMSVASRQMKAPPRGASGPDRSDRGSETE